MPQPGFSLGLLAGLILVLLHTAKKCVFRVDEGHLAVLIEFGRAEFADPGHKMLRTYGPGLHFKAPWKEIHVVSMMEQSLELSGEEGGIPAMAQDGTILRLDSKLRFEPLREELYHYLFALRAPVEHIKGLFTCLLRNEIANFSSALATSTPGSSGHPGSYALIRRERRLLNQRIEEFTRKQIGGRYGVRFDAVDLTDILPPDELANALNAVFNAHAEADTAYARAEGECRQRVLSSEQGVQIARARAQASEIEILGLAKFLQEISQKGMLQHYVERRRSEVHAESRTVFIRRSS